MQKVQSPNLFTLFTLLIFTTLLHLPSNIVKIRKLKAKTQPAFAEIMKVPLTKQKSYELGRANPDILYIQRLMRISGLSENQLKNVNITEQAIVKALESVQKVQHDGDNDVEVPESHITIQTVIEKQNTFIEILNNTLARQNSLLERQANNIEVRVERTDTNLEQVLHYLQALSMNMKSGREVILRSLARLEKMPESVLVEEASKIVEQIGNLQQDKGQSIGRKDKVP